MPGKTGRPKGVFASNYLFTPDKCPCGVHPFYHRCRLCGFQRPQEGNDDGHPDQNPEQRVA